MNLHFGIALSMSLASSLAVRISRRADLSLFLPHSRRAEVPARGASGAGCTTIPGTSGAVVAGTGAISVLLLDAAKVDLTLAPSALLRRLVLPI